MSDFEKITQQLREVLHSNSMLQSELLSIREGLLQSNKTGKKEKLENLSQLDLLKIRSLLLDLQLVNAQYISTLNSMRLDLIDAML